VTVHSVSQARRTNDQRRPHDVRRRRGFARAGHRAGGSRRRPGRGDHVAAGAEISFVAAGRLGDHLVATATERTRYGRNGIYDVTVHRETPGGPEVVAEFRGRSRVLSVKREEA
jgi:hypothetical protein